MARQEIDLRSVFARIAARMQEEFEEIREAVSHAGLKGGGNEEIVERFLKDHLPQSIGVVSGEIVDSTGGRTRQMDVVLTDAARTPVLHRAGDTQVIPVESVIAVVEVKAKLRVADLSSVLQNMRSVKELQKIAYYQQGSIINTTNLFGQEFQYFPTIYSVFAFESEDLGILARRLNEVQAASPVEERIDTICSLEHGVVLNASPTDTYSGTPEADTQMAGYDTANALLLFFLLLSHPVLQARQPPISLLQYVEGTF